MAEKASYSAKTEEVRRTIERLIEHGSVYDATTLDRIYHRDLKIIKIDEHDQVTSRNRVETLDFFRAKRESGAKPLSREAEFLYADADDRNGYVVVVRRMQISHRREKSIYSIRLIWEDSRWQVIHETAFVHPIE